MSVGSRFQKYQVIINFLVFINKVIPKKINKLFLVLFRNIPTPLGVLIRYVLLKNICLSVGKNLVVYEGVVFDSPETMSFGDNVSINPYCYLAGEIIIGDNVSIAHTTAFHSYNHTWNNPDLTINRNPLYSKKIIVKNDVWFGCNCIILSGVKIDNRTVVAAGSVVNKSLKSNSLFAGNPARFIKSI
ncbi:acyltransferase [Tenacibaculum aestuarii]|uniref:acyltransferase n=1 Tax=Tenacibaculum aestuarii TaxID=362781 RepID=UPI0038959B44